jgi:hypothetical protein
MDRLAETVPRPALRRVWAGLALLMTLPLAFFEFHAFIFLVWFYGREDLWLSVWATPVLGLLLFPRLAVLIRPWLFLGRYGNPLLDPPPLRLILEVMAWWVVTIGLWLHLYRKFDFSNELRSAPVWAVLLAGYGGYFATVAALPFLARFLFQPVRRLFYELASYRIAVRRISAVAIAFGVLDLLFAISYRVIAINDPNSFQSEIGSLGDSLYLSTATLTVFDSVEIAPHDGVSRTFVSIELAMGVFIFAALLSFVISASLESRGLGRQTAGVTGGKRLPTRRPAMTAPKRLRRERMRGRVDGGSSGRV